MEHGDRHALAHQPGDRDPDAKCAHDPLDHHVFRQAKSIVKSGKTEEYRCQKAVDRVSFEVIGCCFDDFRLMAGKNACQEISVEERKPEHKQADHRGCQDSLF